MKNEPTIKRLTCTLATGTALLLAGSLEASTVLYEGIDMVGNDNHRHTYKLEAFEINEPNSFPVVMNNYELTESFKPLYLRNNDSTHKHTEDWDGVSVTHDDESGDYNAGLKINTGRRWDMDMDMDMDDNEYSHYHIEDNDDTVVPLPASAPLFLSGLVGLGLFRNRKKRH